MNNRTLIQKHQTALDAIATEKTKLWWEKYMKQVIPFRGVGIPANRELLATWRIENGVDAWPLEEQLAIALAFFEEPMAEDKLAGILYLQNHLYDKLPWQMLIGQFERVYAKELIFDWNVCDWFCVRVLGPMIQVSGLACAQAIAGWHQANYLWQARSSVVPFVNLATDRQYYPIIQEACSTLINRDERFAKTAVGWILREISNHDKAFVTAFVEDNLTAFSKESLGNAIKYFDKDQKRAYLQKLKSMR